MYRLGLVAALALFVTACIGPQYQHNKSAIAVLPVVETTPVPSNDDAADDPAIWVHPSDTSKSLVLGTDKRAGLAVYNLQGEQIQFIERGRLNNVDVRQGISVAGQQLDIAVATNKTNRSIDVFVIGSNGLVRFLQAQVLAIPKLYGICLHHRNGTDLVAFVNNKAGWHQQWLLNPNGQLTPTMEGEFLIASQPEGCVVNDSTNTLYFGEEDLGVWKMPADFRTADKRVLIDEVGAGHLSADVEGMAIYHAEQQSILVVSSQGDNSYALYDLADDTFLISVRIAKNVLGDVKVDGAQETDGIAVSSANFGGALARGLFVHESH